MKTLLVLLLVIAGCAPAAVSPVATPALSQIHRARVAAAREEDACAQDRDCAHSDRMPYMAQRTALLEIKELDADPGRKPPYAPIFFPIP